MRIAGTLPKSSFKEAQTCSETTRRQEGCTSVWSRSSSGPL